MHPSEDVKSIVEYETLSSWERSRLEIHVIVVSMWMAFEAMRTDTMTEGVKIDGKEENKELNSVTIQQQ